MVPTTIAYESLLRFRRQSSKIALSGLRSLRFWLAAPNPTAFTIPLKVSHLSRQNGAAGMWRSKKELQPCCDSNRY